MNTPQLADSLRAAVLQAAIKGELTERSSENARDLLLRIQNEKQTLQAKGSLKKTKASAPVTADEVPFDIPENWVWVRLGDLCLYAQRGKSPKYSDIQQYPVISQKCVQWSGFDIKPAKFIDPESISSYSEERILRDGDLLWNSTGTGTVGRIVKYRADFNPYSLAVADSHVTILRFFQNVNADYVEAFIKSPTIQANIEDLCTGSTKQKELSLGTIKNLLIPLPPLAEQQAIAEKLTRLLAEIDRLKAEEQSLASLQKAYPQTLRASVLAAAVRGDLNERSQEHARDLLLHIQNEKQALQAKGSLKKTKAPAPVTADEVPFEIPENWVWVRLGDVILQNIGGGTPSKQEPSYWNGDIPWASVKDLNCDVLTKTIDSITAEGLENSSSNLIPKGTLIICTRMGLGKIALAEIDVAINQDLRAIFLPECLNKHYFYHFYRTLKMEGKGATVKGITVEELHNTPFPLPPLPNNKQSWKNCPHCSPKSTRWKTLKPNASNRRNP
ncbi:TPA: restriction endonuclease subunit S [Neisseria bacilliformis]